MSEKGFVRYWYTGVSLVAGIVLAVAALLLLIIGTARAILSNAERALALAQELVDTTRPIWQLDTTNHVAQSLLWESRAIEEHASELADQLERAGTGG